MLNFSYEQTFWDQGRDIVIGIDEVGRGPLAGPVVVGAVVFNKNHLPIAGINDSKKIPKKSLQNISDEIKKNCIGFSIGVGSVELINNRGIVYALQDSISQAIDNLEIIKNNPNKIAIIIDGLPYRDTTQFSSQCQYLHKHQYITYETKADANIYSVAAASIIAKAYRDDLMAQLAKEYTEYGWDHNAGYGTKFHREAIQKYGLTLQHRELFCRSVLKLNAK